MSTKGSMRRFAYIVRRRGAVQGRCQQGVPWGQGFLIATDGCHDLAKERPDGKLLCCACFYPVGWVSENTSVSFSRFRAMRVDFDFIEDRAEEANPPPLRMVSKRTTNMSGYGKNMLTVILTWKVGRSGCRLSGAMSLLKQERSAIVLRVILA